MKLFVWLLRAVVFIALFGLAVKNGSPVELRFFLGGSWQAPLSLVILAAFAGGVVVGLTVAVTTLLRQGRDLRRLRRQPDDGHKAPPA